MAGGYPGHLLRDRGVQLMRISLLMTFLLGTLAASAILNVMQYRASQGNPPGEPGPSPYEGLDLTAEQIRALNECGQNCCDAVEEMRAESKRVTYELRAALSRPDLDPEKVDALAEELCNLRNQEVDNNVETLLQVRGVLEPDQLRELNELLYPDTDE